VRRVLAANMQALHPPTRSSGIDLQALTMSHTPHELAAEFPEQQQRIHDLKLSDAHFARLCDEYHEVNRAVHRAESRAEAVAEAHEAALRRQRMTLKDQIAARLAA
jgi:hypothetical protein